MCIKCCFHATIISTKSCTPRIMLWTGISWYSLIIHWKVFHYYLLFWSCQFTLFITVFPHECKWVWVGDIHCSSLTNSHRASINTHKDKHVICHKNMQICRAETNMPKIRNYCREYPKRPANLNHLLPLYEPIDKTRYAYGLQGSTANRAAINFQSYRRKKGFISTIFLSIVFFTLLAITLASQAHHHICFYLRLCLQEIPCFESCLAQLRPRHTCIGRRVHLSFK